MEPMPPFTLLTDRLSSYLKCSSVDPRTIHSLSLKLGCLFSIFLSNNLLHAYVSQSNSGSACKLFEEIPHPNVVTWTSIISCYAQMENLKDAIFCFREMQQRDELPNKFTFGSIFTGCTRNRDSRTGVQIHGSSVKFGLDFDAYIASMLIDMYAKCGKVDDSWKAFSHTPDKNVVAWTTMITSLANSRQCQYQNAAFGLFKDMVSRGVWPVSMTFAGLAKVFDEPTKLNQAKQAHGYMVKVGVEVDDHLGSALITMYGRCGGIDEVIRLSSRMNLDIVSSTALLAAYIQNGHGIEAIQVFRKMVEVNMMIDPFVIASIIGACSNTGEVRQGKEVHGYAIRRNFTSDITVGNSLITLYGKCGKIWKAEQVFFQMGDRDIISWTAILTCYTQNDCGEEALSVFQEMLREGINPPIFSVTGAIRACSHIVSLPIGRQIHSKTVRMGIDSSLSVGNSLITMYAKCGDIEASSSVFESMYDRDIVSFNALITGFSHHGYEKQALKLFHLMVEAGVEPDDYTFIGVLATCSRVGLIKEGWEYFRMMKETCRIEPKMEHYACMVDLLGRSGKLQEAVDFILNVMPRDPDILVWEALLASCKVYGDIELGMFAAKKILEMRAENTSPYITLSSMHAMMDKWDRKACFLDMMRDRGLQKESGKSWIEAHSWLEDTQDAL